VVFRAHDRETGGSVALLRFFPSGPDGGGLQEAHQETFTAGLERLAEIRHPSLRAVVGGGCDPVDGMPFMASEWVEGVTLLSVVESDLLDVELAKEALDLALEISEVISGVVGEERLWVETDLQSVILGNEESGRLFTFRISPMHLCAGHDQTRSLGSAIVFAEKMMGWSGRLVNAKAGGGLAEWIRAMKAAVPDISLHEARELLAAAVGQPPPAPAQANLVPATPLELQSAKAAMSTWKMLLVAGLLGVAVVGFAWVKFGVRGFDQASKEAEPVPVAVTEEAEEAQDTEEAQEEPSVAMLQEAPVEAEPETEEPTPSVPSLVINNGSFEKLGPVTGHGALRRPANWVSENVKAGKGVQNSTAPTGFEGNKASHGKRFLRLGSDPGSSGGAYQRLGIAEAGVTYTIMGDFFQGRQRGSRSAPNYHRGIKTFRPTIELYQGDPRNGGKVIRPDDLSFTGAGPSIGVDKGGRSSFKLTWTARGGEEVYLRLSVPPVGKGEIIRGGFDKLGIRTSKPTENP